MSLRFSYTLIAPIYDLFVSQLTRALRQQSLQSLGDIEHKHILLPGIGTGLDLPYLPIGAHYTGLDLTPAMLKRAEQQKPEKLDIKLVEGNLLKLDFEDNQFDIVIMHLILAVVPDPVSA
ncbi:MAG: class I SAM-dependent methyltransferase, partial [Gammaproteobacteria bacterium]|nr:class I SAM-dependent methyltransferase [Gammaproteobacteria bacterium]